MFKEIDHTETTVELLIDLNMHPLQCRHCHWTTLHSSLRRKQTKSVSVQAELNNDCRKHNLIWISLGAFQVLCIHNHVHNSTIL